MQPELRRRVSIAASPDAIWAALTESGEVAAWTEDGDARVSAAEGGEVDLFGGAVAGRVIAAEPARRLEWRVTVPPVPGTVTAVWRIEPLPGSTLVELTDAGVRDEDDRARLVDIWDREWLAPLSAWLEPGSE